MKKRLAFISNSMDIGGVARVLLTLLDNIDYTKYDVSLWVKKGGGALESKINPKVHIRHWGEPISSKKQLLCLAKQKQFGEIIKGLLYRLQIRIASHDWVSNELYEAKIYALGIKEKVDCVIAFQGLYSGVVATALHRFQAPNKIAWIHGENNYSSLQTMCLAKQYPKFDKIFCVSKATQSAFSKQFPCVRQKTAVFYNLIDRKNILTAALTPVPPMKFPPIVTVGRLSKPKGQIMIPQIARMLLDERYEIYWYLIGDGELKEVIESKIVEYQVQKHVFLMGALDNPLPFIKNCYIYVQSSFSEGYCTTTTEAKILGKPIVTTNAPGMQEQFTSGENGLIVDATPEALFEGIRTLLDNPALAEKFSKNLSEEICDNSSELNKLYSLIEGVDYV